MKGEWIISIILWLVKPLLDALIELSINFSKSTIYISILLAVAFVSLIHFIQTMTFHWKKKTSWLFNSLIHYRQFDTRIIDFFDKFLDCNASSRPRRARFVPSWYAIQLYQLNWKLAAPKTLADLWYSPLISLHNNNSKPQ